MLQYVAVCVLQCVAVCCSVCFPRIRPVLPLSYVAVCCSVCVPRSGLALSLTGRESLMNGLEYSLKFVSCVWSLVT